jgi:hypothetical protein
MSPESVPNYSTEVRRLYDTGLFDLKTHHGQGAFVDACVSMLHGKNARWGHLKKKSGQTDVHGHGEDAALFLFADGTALAVDFIGGAGGPNPQPGWGVGSFVYKGSDWLDPTEHARQSAHTCPQVPAVLPKGEAFAKLQALNAFYQAPEGLQRPGGLVRHDSEGRSVADMEAIAQWFYQLVIEGVSLEDVFTQIRNSHEWKSKHP